MAYGKKLIDHFNNPRNIGELDENDKDTGIGMVGAPSCGDVLKLSIKVLDNKIVDAKFLAFGCGAAIASSSLVTEKIIGQSLTAVQAISNREIADELALPPIKLNCSVLAQEAIQEAVKNYKSK